MKTFQSVCYGLTVLNCALEQAKGGGVTARELSEKCGLKLTQHLRRNLKQWVEAGKLQAVQAYTEKGHLATYYIIPIPETDISQSKLPF